MTKTLLDYTIELNDGNKIPAFGLGTVLPKTDEASIGEIVKIAIRSGIRHIDTAWVYGSEKYIGKALKELFEAGEIKREELFITTKVWGTLWNQVERSVNESLDNLGVEYLDLVLQHWPVAFKGAGPDGLPKAPTVDGVIQYEENANVLETYKQLVKIQKETNLIRSIGVSNFTEQLLERTIEETGVVPAINQIELHPRISQTKLVKFFESKGVKIEAYSPLGSYGAPLIKDELVQELAQKYNVDPAAVLLSYHVLSGRIALTRTASLERAKNLYQSAPLTEEDIARLDNLGVTNPKRYINVAWGADLGFEHWGK